MIFNKCKKKNVQGYINKHIHLCILEDKWPQCELCHGTSTLKAAFAKNIVFVLWQEEGYTVKYSLSTWEIPRAEPEGFPKGSGYISPYIPTWVIIQTFSISKVILPVLSFLVGQYWKSWISVLVLQLGLYFPLLPSRWSNTGLYRLNLLGSVEDSVMAALGNTQGQESNIRRVKFQYYPF